MSGPDRGDRERCEAFEAAVLESVGLDMEDPDTEKAVQAAFSALSDTLTRARGDLQSRAPYEAQHADAAAALVFGARTHRIVAALLDAYPPPPGPILELGAGCGPAALATRSDQHPDITLCDRTKRRMALADPLFRRLGREPPRTCVEDLRRGLPGRDQRWQGILAPFVLNELVEGESAGPGEGREPVGAALLRRWLSRLEPGGRLYIVEPGTRAAAQRLQGLRDHLRETVRILGPCTHAALCPLQASPRDWCHLTWPVDLGPVASGLLRGAGRDPGTQRFSWLILEKSPPQSQEHQGRVLEIRRREKAKRRIMVCEAAGYRTVTVLKRHRALFGALDELVPGAVCQLSEEGLVTKGDGDRLTDPEAFQTLREL